MAHRTFDDLWADAQNIISEAIRNDGLLQQTEEEPTIERDKVICRPIVGELYARYIVGANILMECYDLMVQPQKRIVIRKLLDACLGRIVELKHDLISIDNKNFSHVEDNTLSKLRVTPLDLELKVPDYFHDHIREAPIDDWRNQLEAVLRKAGISLTLDDEKPKPLTESEAVRLLQTHERARQGRLRCQFMREIRMMKEKGKVEQAADEESSEGFGGLLAALRIQRLWRGYMARRNTKRRKLNEMLLIGMLPPVKRQTEAREMQKEICEYRRQLQKEFDNNYEEALAATKEMLQKQRGDAMMEDMREEIRHWLMEYNKHSGKLPDFPSEERGGSRLMFSRQESGSEISKSTQMSSKDSKGKKDSKGSKKDKDSVDSKKKGDGDDDEDDVLKQKYFTPIPSNFLTDIIAGNEEYEEVWKNKDESSNPSQQHYTDMMIAEKTIELEKEMRKIVDDTMRDELELLQAALDRDRGGKKSKKASKKVRRGGKKSKKKKEKDLTPDRTLESLFEELVCNGIIRSYPKCRLADFIGERSFDPIGAGSFGDMRQLMMEYCIVPLSSETIHENTPLIRSILLAGPAGSGKKQLVYSVCTEIDAILFDISAQNIVGKYPGKSGLIMLMHLVSKVSRLLQPSVIFVDSAEKTFMRKVPKTDKTDPKRLKKDLPKLVKGLCPEDRVILFGVSQKPWECDQKLLVQTYQINVMLPPRARHSDLSIAWRQLLVAPYAALTSFDVATIARLSDGYTIGSVASVVKEVMTCKRMVRLRAQPLQLVELLNSLSSKTPVWKEQQEALEDWLE